MYYSMIYNNAEEFLLKKEELSDLVFNTDTCVCEKPDSSVDAEDLVDCEYFESKFLCFKKLSDVSFHFTSPSDGVFDIKAVDSCIYINDEKAFMSPYTNDKGAYSIILGIYGIEKTEDGFNLMFVYEQSLSFCFSFMISVTFDLELLWIYGVPDLFDNFKKYKYDMMQFYSNDIYYLERYHYTYKDEVYKKSSQSGYEVLDCRDMVNELYEVSTIEYLRKNNLFRIADIGVVQCGVLYDIRFDKTFRGYKFSKDSYSLVVDIVDNKTVTINGIKLYDFDCTVGAVLRLAHCSMDEDYLKVLLIVYSDTEKVFCLCIDRKTLDVRYILGVTNAYPSFSGIVNKSRLLF